MIDLEALGKTVIEGDAKATLLLTTASLEEGVGPDTILNKGLIAGMTVVGTRFKANEMYRLRSN